VQRILLIVVVLFIIWKVASAFGKRMSRQSAGADDFSRFSARRRDHRRRMRTAARGAQEELVECARCATCVPVGRALVAGDGRVYCSESCRDELTSGSAPAGS
jgi:hypothetical protein